MTSIGETLRRERVKRKLDVEGVSRELKISPRFLEAIEHEDFDKLPGQLFARSFVRQYARFLGLDEEEIAGELKKVLDPQAAMPSGGATANSAASGREPEFSLPRVENWGGVGDRPSRWSKSLPALIMVVAVMLVCSLAYSWLQRPRRATVGVPPAQQAANDALKTEAPASVAEAPSAATTQDAAAERQSAAAATAEATRAASEAAKPTTAIPQPGLEANAPVRVEMAADEPVWVSVKADGKYLFSGTLQANETKTAGANENLTIRLGNAGGIRISLNGKPIGPVGPKGQVRTVQLTSGGFQILAPEAPNPAPSIDVSDPL
ncbi:MAG TPA: RodZ domain-containing protein [Bryobacteraceae bacterium]|nr:RodZ domain-containing protein [Bryobacteraceae bacterium]